MSPAIIANRESFQDGRRVVFVLKYPKLSFSSTPFTGTERKKSKEKKKRKM